MLKKVLLPLLLLALVSQLFPVHVLAQNGNSNEESTELQGDWEWQIIGWNNRARFVTQTRKQLVFPSSPYPNEGAVLRLMNKQWYTPRFTGNTKFIYPVSRPSVPLPWDALVWMEVVRGSLEDAEDGVIDGWGWAALPAGTPIAFQGNDPMWHVWCGNRTPLIARIVPKEKPPPPPIRRDEPPSRRDEPPQRTQPPECPECPEENLKAEFDGRSTFWGDRVFGNLDDLGWSLLIAVPLGAAFSTKGNRWDGALNSVISTTALNRTLNAFWFAPESRMDVYLKPVGTGKKERVRIADDLKKNDSFSFSYTGKDPKGKVQTWRGSGAWLGEEVYAEIYRSDGKLCRRFSFEPKNPKLITPFPFPDRDKPVVVLVPGKPAGRPGGGDGSRPQ